MTTRSAFSGQQYHTILMLKTSFRRVWAKFWSAVFAGEIACFENEQNRIHVFDHFGHVTYIMHVHRT